MGEKTEILTASEAALIRAAHAIAHGGVVAFPTDTVYGLCCDLFNVSAIHRIYRIKERAEKMPLIAMYAETAQWPRVAASLPLGTRELIDRWWPGPLTLIVPAHFDVPAEVLGGGNTIGMRIPNNPVTLQFLRLCARPLATTSANMSGQPSACTAAAVAAQLDGKVDLILDGGACNEGMASTVLDCTTTPMTILREGPITRVDLGL